MPFRFIHTSDWHLGKRFARFDAGRAAILKNARFDAVSKVACLAAELRVDAVLVAGDSFDRMPAEREDLEQALVAMRPYAGPWIMITGNHDAPPDHAIWKEFVRQDRGPAIHILKPSQAHFMDNGQAAILGASLEFAQSQRDPTAWMNEIRTDGMIRVGLAHGSIEKGFDQSIAVNNPISPKRRVEAGLDYLALGDWHRSLSPEAATYYCGAPEADSFGVKDVSGVLLVEIDEPETKARISFHQTGSYSWQEKTLHLSTVKEGWERELEALKKQFEQNSRHTLLRLKLEGSMDLSSRYRLDDMLSTFAMQFFYLEVLDDGLLTLDGPHPPHLENELLARTADILRSKEGSEQVAVVQLALSRLYTIDQKISRQR